MSSLSLYVIDQEMRQIVDQIIENGGLVDEETLAALAIKQEELEGKAVSYAHVIKTAEYEVDVITEEMARLAKLKKGREKTVDFLKNSIGAAMIAYSIERVETPTIKIFFRPSKAVEIIDEAAIPEEFLNTKTSVSIDKVKITAELKAGRSVFGAELQEKKNLQIK